MIIFYQNLDHMSKVNFSVLMSVYCKDNPNYFTEAISSIHDEQILKPSQIVIVKDGILTDELNKIIEKWKGKLGNILDVIEVEKNIGLAAALNLGLKHCKYELIARMDADDISLPTRFQSQTAYFQNHPELSVISSWIDEVETDLSNSLGIRKIPEDNQQILDFAKTRNPINHPSAFFKKADVLAVGGYPIFARAQDYALWSLMLTRNYKFGNVPKVLLLMRTGAGLLNRRGFKYFNQERKILYFQKSIGFISSSEYLKNLMIRFLFRIQPNFIKALLYKNIKD
jgi:glycosyltransferase involved in cell wall biosynthesis